MFQKFLEEVLKLAPRQMWAVEQIPVYFSQIFESFSFKKLGAMILAIGEMFGLIIFDTPVTPRGEELNLTGYNLVFVDEFEGDTLNTDVWEYRASGERRGGFNAESQVRVDNGKMIMTGEYLTDGEYGEGWYTAMIKLKERYCKGYFEIRCIVNDEPEFWSAFWIQADAPYDSSASKGGVGGAEIDIFESSNTADSKNENSVTHAIHCAGVDGVKEDFQSIDSARFTVTIFITNIIHTDLSGPTRNIYFI